MFWLDVRKRDEYALSEQIDELKQKRLYAKTLREGIRLICDLRAGRLDVLFELFPWVQVEFLKHMQTIQPVRSEAEQELQRQLERLERLMLERGYVPEQSARPLPSRPELPPPLETLPPDHDTTASENFLNAFL
jgi:hypothetical protein